MNLLGLLGFGRMKEPVRVYCQACGDDLTGKSADVTNTGRVYCHGYDDVGIRCVDVEILIQAERGEGVLGFVAEYLGPRQIRKDIKRGAITQYGPLEEPKRSRGVKEIID